MATATMASIQVRCTLQFSCTTLMILPGEVCQDLSASISHLLPQESYTQAAELFLNLSLKKIDSNALVNLHFLMLPLHGAYQY